MNAPAADAPVSERIRYHGARHFLVLNGVVQQCRDDQFGVLAVRCLCHQGRDFKQVIDVRFLGGAFAALMHMPARGSVSGPKDGDPLFCHFAPPGGHG